MLENTAIDIPTVFGPGSDEASRGRLAIPGQAFADFVGIGVHCAQGSSVCGASTHAKPDLLPDEPGGYSGYSGLFGAKYVNPVIHPGGPMTNLDGQPIQDSTGHLGFPGFDGMFATNSLSWVAQMQESGIPVTYAYISDAHDGHGNSGSIHFAYAPGEAGYVQQLHDYDVAFGKFFDRLAADGINKSNTLFLFTVDEGDHFAGSQPNNPSCDGVTVACDYGTNPVGEINGDLRRMILTQYGDNTPSRSTPTTRPNVYITGNPSRTAAVTRNLEREMAQLHWLNPYTGVDQHDIMVALADPVEMKTLHMVTADPARTPTFTPFADPDWFFFATGGARRLCDAGSLRVDPGADEPELRVEPRRHPGRDRHRPGPATSGRASRTSATTNSVWTDHTDHRPTLLTLLGLKDDYQTDGRAVTADRRRERAAGQPPRAPSEPRAARCLVQAADGVVRRVLDVHAGRLDARPVEQLGRRRDLQRHRKPAGNAHRTSATHWPPTSGRGSTRRSSTASS